MYWGIVVLLFILQAAFSFQSLGVARDEAIHTVREVFWWQNREIFQAQNSNIGWYTTLSFLYSIFGFDMDMGRFYRLFLSLVSLFSTAFLLKRFLGEKNALVPLLVIGLSPTLLFWNTINLPFGIDLQYLPIVLFLLLSSLSYLRYLGWLLAMFAWLSYPTFAFYLPALILSNLGYLRNLRYLFLSLFAFLLPLILALFWAKDPLRMLHDPEVGRGLFTAGGGIIFSADNFTRTIAATFENLFIRATSYYLEMATAEFSYFLPLFSFVFVLWMSFKIRKLHTTPYILLPVYLALLTMVFNLIVVSFGIDGGIPGGRRNTPILAAFYVLFAIVWLAHRSLERSRRGEGGWGWFTRALLLALLVHHIIAYPVNLAELKTPSPWFTEDWFYPNAQAKINSGIQTLQSQDLYLDCGNCTYSNIYATLKGACVWNKLECHDIYGNISGYGWTKLSVEFFQKSRVEYE